MKRKKTTQEILLEKRGRKVKISITISEEILEELKRAAEIHDINLSNLIQGACEMALGDEYFSGLQTIKEKEEGMD